MAQTDFAEYDEDDYLHLGALIADYLRYFFKRWYILLFLMLVCGGCSYWNNARSYQPYYQSSTTYIVEQTTSVTLNATIASRIASGVSTITRISDFRSDLHNELGDNYLYSNYSFRGEATESANIFTVTVQASDPEYVNQLLDAFKTIYPKWVSMSSGCSIRSYSADNYSDGNPINTWNKLKCILYGLILGGFLWLVLATFKIFTVRKIHGEIDMYQVVNATCMGVLPEVSKKKRTNNERETLLLTNKHLDKAYHQSFASMRSRIERLAEESNQKTFLITSTLTDEGKSIISMNLALSLQKHGKKVVLLCADLRKNEEGKIKQSKIGQFGLSDYLTGKTDDFTQIIAEENGLKIIYPGKSCQEFAGDMNSDKMQLLMNELQEMADIVLIDTPPVALFGDALALSEYADKIFYVIRGDYARVAEIRKGIEPFWVNQKLGGYILNRIVASKSLYGYYYGYGGSFSKYRNYSRYGNAYGYGNRKYNK